MSGGQQNAAQGDHATVSGGENNTAYSDHSFVGGGIGNYANGGFYNTIGGGEDNLTDGDLSTVAGGWENEALGSGSAIAGGSQNKATGGDAFVPAGYRNYAGGAHSFAGGQYAHVRDAAEAGQPVGDMNTFIWCDGMYLSCVSTGEEQFFIGAPGGFSLNVPPINANVAMTVAAPPGNPLYSSILLRGFNAADGVLISSGDATANANNASFYVDQYNGSAHTRRLSLDGTGKLTITNQAYKPGGGSWAASSDVRLKTNVKPLTHSLDRLLELKGVTFEYVHPDHGMHPSGTFSGFIAQEVEKVFPNWIDHDNDGYLTVGPQGFEALTVEALRELRTSENDKVAALEHDNAELRELVANQAKAVADLRRQVASISNAGDTKARQVASTTP